LLGFDAKGFVSLLVWNGDSVHENEIWYATANSDEPHRYDHDADEEQCGHLLAAYWVQNGKVPLNGDNSQEGDGGHITHSLHKVGKFTHHLKNNKT